MRMESVRISADDIKKEDRNYSKNVITAVLSEGTDFTYHTNQKNFCSSDEDFSLFFVAHLIG